MKSAFYQNVKNQKVTLLILLCLFAAGLAIRLFDLGNPPLDFHPARQFHSAILARGFYARLAPALPDFERGKYIAQGGSEPWIEPPVMEAITAVTYLLAGSDYLWIPRLYAIFFWLLGGVGFYLLVKKLAGMGGAVFGLLFYLLLPYGVIASRSFQPDPLMICLIIWSLWALLRWTPEADWKATILAGLLAGLAILIKQVSVFFLGGGLAAFLLVGWGLKKMLRSPKAWVLLGLAILPVVFYNIWGLFIEGFLRQQYADRLYPELWSQVSFYLRWMVEIDDTVGFLCLLAALGGIWLIKERRIRAVFYGYFVGYVIYGFTFAHHIVTHDYYQLPLIPLVAIGLAPLAGALINRLREISPGRMAPAILVALTVVGCFYYLWRDEDRIKKVDYSAEPALWQSLGNKMGHENANVEGLFDDYGMSLTYWGLTTPVVWPNTADMDLSNIKLTTKQIDQRLMGKYYFVVTDFVDFDKQPVLKQTLEENYGIFDKGTGYLIFDMRKPKS
jgi:4-amino-4-deoxy-L-arabinose transferase-like glycosyltransferase